MRRRCVARAEKEFAVKLRNRMGFRENNFKPVRKPALVRFGQVTARSAASAGMPVATSTVRVAIMRPPLRWPSRACEIRWRVFVSQIFPGCGLDFISRDGKKSIQNGVYELRFVIEQCEAGEKMH